MKDPYDNLTYTKKSSSYQLVADSELALLSSIGHVIDYANKTQKIKLNGRKVTIRYMRATAPITENMYCRVSFSDTWRKVSPENAGYFVADFPERMFMLPDWGFGATVKVGLSDEDYFMKSLCFRNPGIAHRDKQTENVDKYATKAHVAFMGGKPFNYSKDTVDD